MAKGKTVAPEWDYTIKPQRGWFELDLRSLWRYRDLCMQYVRRDFVTTYQQTILGPLWLVVSPLLTIVIYMFIFGGLAGLSTEGVPQPLFYMAGILFWNYFTDCFDHSRRVFFSQHTVFSKVWFPRLVVPIAGCISSLLKLGIQLVVFILIYLFCLTINNSLSVNWVVCLFPVFVFMIACHGLSWGLIVSSMTFKYRDLHILIGFLIQMLMYATPVVYPLDTIPEKYRFIVSLNPLTPIFETFKYGCFSRGDLDWWGLLYSFVFMVVVTIYSVLLFNRVEQNFIDSI